ncbi:MAG: YdeI/OmpD-associated family protein [Chitinophagaceae bacterium]|nr:YdeI/OmpD-associated family protein [Chitinophagaceae bacterium]
MFSIEFTSTLHAPQAGGYMAYLEVPADIYAKFTSKKPPRIVVTVNGKYKWKAAIMSLGNGNGMVGVSRAKIKENGWHTGMQVKVAVQPDTDEVTFDMPEELQEVLGLDDVAQNHYNALTDGKKRSLILFVAQPKSAQLRVDRALLIADNLKRLKGKGSVIDITRKIV